MINNVTGKGGQISSNTLTGNFSNVNSIEPIDSVQMPVEQNENIDEQMDHGKESKEYTQEKEIKSAVEKLNKFLQGEATHIEYERHDKFKSQFIIKIVNNETKKVIKEIPSKKILDMVAEMCKLAGVIVDEKA